MWVSVYFKPSQSYEIKQKYSKAISDLLKIRPYIKWQSGGIITGLGRPYGGFVIGDKTELTNMKEDDIKLLLHLMPDLIITDEKPESYVWNKDLFPNDYQESLNEPPWIVDCR